jgi:two-component system OmpR family response regulator
MALHALVVDDERDVAEGWGRALRLAGHDVKVATDAASALDLCDETHFDVVVLDFIMPEMSGVELLARLRKKLPLLRSIIISGKLDERAGEEEIGRRLKEQVEADRYLHKPVSNERLLAEINALFSGRRDEAWDKIAQRVVAADQQSVGAARRAERDLRKLKTKKKKK